MHQKIKFFSVLSCMFFLFQQSTSAVTNVEKTLNNDNDPVTNSGAFIDYKTEKKQLDAVDLQNKKNIELVNSKESSQVDDHVSAQQKDIKSLKSIQNNNDDINKIIKNNNVDSIVTTAKKNKKSNKSGVFEPDSITLLSNESLKKYKGYKSRKDFTIKKLNNNQLVIKNGLSKKLTAHPLPTGKRSSSFGYRRSGRSRQFHKGLDIAARPGTPIHAAGVGTVAISGWLRGYGKVVYINHGDGLQTRYAHCSSLLVSKGQRVQAGQKIAKVGNTGRSSGPHLHFEVRKNGKAQNPSNYIR